MKAIRIPIQTHKHLKVVLKYSNKNMKISSKSRKMTYFWILMIKIYFLKEKEK